MVKDSARQIFLNALSCLCVSVIPLISEVPLDQRPRMCPSS